MKLTDSDGKEHTRKFQGSAIIVVILETKTKLSMWQSL